MTFFGDDETKVAIVVPAGEEEVVEGSHDFFNALGLKKFKAVDELEEDEAHVLLPLLQVKTFPTLLQILGEGFERLDL